MANKRKIKAELISSDSSGSEDTEQNFAIVTSPYGFIMKLNLTAGAMEAKSLTKEPPTIQFDCSDFRMRFPPTAPTLKSKDLNLFPTMSRSKTPSFRKPKMNKSQTPSSIDNSEYNPSEMSDQEESEPIFVRTVVRKTRKRKVQDESQSNSGKMLSNEKNPVAFTEPKFTRSAAKRLKSEVQDGQVMPSSFSGSIPATRKRQTRYVRSRSVSQNKSSETLPSTKRSRRGKKTPDVDLQQAPSASYIPNAGYPVQTNDYISPITTPLNDSMPCLQPVRAPPNNNHVMHYAYQDSEKVSHHYYNIQMVYQGAPFFPLPISIGNDSDLPYQFDIGMAMTYHEDSNIVQPQFYYCNTNTNNTIMPYLRPADDLPLLLNDGTAFGACQQAPQTVIGGTPAPEPNEINLDYYDPLYFEPMDDLTEFDLMSIIDENQDYCAKIYNCNPISNYILVDQVQNGSLSTPRHEIHNSLSTGDQKDIQFLIPLHYIPLHPILEPEEIDKILGDEMEPSHVYQCPLCLDKFSDYLSARYHYHTDVTGKESPAQLAKSA